MSGEEERQDGWPQELSLDDRPGPAARISKAKGEAMIAAAFEAAGYDEDDQAGAAVSRSAAPRRHLLPMVAAAMLALVGVGSASAAVMWWASQRPQAEQPARPSGRRAPAVPAPVQPPVAEAPPEPVEVPEQEAAAPRPRPRPRKVAPRAPEDLLDEANHLRAARKWRQASRAYARVWKRSPKSRAGYVARVAAADLKLTHLGDPRGALADYRAALRALPSGPLSEEVRYGLAEAHRARSDETAEKAALQQFLKRHPRSGLAPKARRRLEEL